MSENCCNCKIEVDGNTDLCTECSEYLCDSCYDKNDYCKDCQKDLDEEDDND